MLNDIIFTITPSFEGLRDASIQAEKNAKATIRTEISVQGRRMVDLLREEAPQGETGKFRKSIGVRDFTVGEWYGFETSAAEPIRTFIVEGTKAHLIPKGGAKPGKFLAFKWKGAPTAPTGRGGMHVFASVNHPGTNPNRYPGRSFRRWLPGARTWLKSIAVSYTRELANASKLPTRTWKI